MRIHDLKEAPIGTIHGNDIKDTGSFAHKVDRDIIASPKARAKIRRVLANVPQTIDLVFLDTGNPVPTDTLNDYLQGIGGVFDYDLLKQKFEVLPDQSSPESIMLVLTQNEGNERIQLSPWMLMHRMGHGLALDEGPENFEGYLQNVVYAFQDIASFLRDGWVIPINKTVYAIATMKSARERKLTSTLEVIFEWLAQYCVTGKVTLNRIDRATFEEMIPKIDGDFLHRPPTDEDIEELNRVISFNESNINSTFRLMMKALQGKVVIL